MYDIASTNLAQRISQLKGVGQVTVGGGSLPAVRVELNPTLLNKLGIGFDEVRSAITSTNANRPKGFLDDGERYWQVQANDQAKSAAEYIPIIVAYRNGAAVRLGDLGEVGRQRPGRAQLRHGQRQARGADDHQPPAQRQHHRGGRQHHGDPAGAAGLDPRERAPAA